MHSTVCYQVGLISEINSMHEHEFWSIQVRLEVIWLSPSELSTSSTSNRVPSEVVESIHHHDNVLVLKPPAIKRKLGLQEVISERSSSRLR